MNSPSNRPPWTSGGWPWTAKSFRVTVRNLTDRPLRFLGFESGCGCSRLTATVAELGPHQAAELTGEFVAQSSNLGAFRKDLKVRWGSADLPAVLVLTGETYREIVLSSETVVLRPDPAAGRGAETTVRVENRGRSEVQLRPDALPPGVTCQPVPLTLPAGGHASLTFACDPWFLAAGAETVHVQTTHPAEGRLKLQLALEPAGALAVRATGLRWGVLSRQELSQQAPPEIRIRGTGLAHLELIDVDAPAFLSCRGRRVEPGQVILDFELLPGRLTANLNSEVVVRLRPKTQPRTVALKVPTSGVLLDP